MTDVVTVTRDLSTIQRLAEDLPEQAEHQANSRVMTGGAAMGELGHVTNLERWAWQQDAAEDAAMRGERSWPTLEHEDDTDEPVLQTLLFWSEQRRRDEGRELDGRTPTIATEAAFLRYYADAMWRDEPGWEDYAADVARARRKLENILAAGRRDPVTRVRCVQPVCEVKPPLRQIVTDDGLQERWKCRACRATYDRAGFEDARRRQWLDAGDHFVSAAEAESLLLMMRVPPANVRKWLAREGLADDDVRYDGRTRMVRWSAVYTRQRAEKAERRSA